MGNWKKEVAKTRGLDEFEGVPNKAINESFKRKHRLNKLEQERRKKEAKALADEVERLRKL